MAPFDLQTMCIPFVTVFLTQVSPKCKSITWILIKKALGHFRSTEEKPCEDKRQRREGGSPKPRDSWSPRKLEEAGRTLP